MTEKPRFKRAFTDERLDQFIDEITSMLSREGVHPLIVQLRKASIELKNTYKIIAEAERMAARIEEICDEPQKPWVGFIIPSEIGNEVTEFLERLSK